MTRPVGRRLLLLGTFAVGIAATAEAAPLIDLRGSVRFEGGASIPEGRIEIFPDDPAREDDATPRVTPAHVASDGKSEVIEFSLSLPRALATSPTLLIVARLERSDGWLLARGSAQISQGAPFEVTLFAALYSR